jgi:hypothetical protein
MDRDALPRAGSQAPDAPVRSPCPLTDPNQKLEGQERVGGCPSPGHRAGRGRVGQGRRHHIFASPACSRVLGVLLVHRIVLIKLLNLKYCSLIDLRNIEIHFFPPRQQVSQRNISLSQRNMKLASVLLSGGCQISKSKQNELLYLETSQISTRC